MLIDCCSSSWVLMTTMRICQGPNFTQTVQVLFLPLPTLSQTWLPAQSFRAEAPKVSSPTEHPLKVTIPSMCHDKWCQFILHDAWSIEPSSLAFLFSAWCTPMSRQRKPHLGKGFPGSQQAGRSWRWWREQGTIWPLLHGNVDLPQTASEAKVNKTQPSTGGNY